MRERERERERTITNKDEPAGTTHVPVCECKCFAQRLQNLQPNAARERGRNENALHFCVQLLICGHAVLKTLRGGIANYPIKAPRCHATEGVHPAVVGVLSVERWLEN